MMDRRNSYMLLAATIVLTFVAYAPIFSNALLDHWDDQWMVVNHFTEGGWTWNNLVELFTGIHRNQYSPLVEMNYMAVHAVCGYYPVGYHVASLLWHVGCIVLVHMLVYRVLLLRGGRERDARWLPAVTTFLFAIHPVNVESVAWASAAKVVMYAFFYLSAILLYLRFVRMQKLMWFILSLMAFVFACLSKEQAITLPLCLVLLDWYIGRDLKDKELWMEKVSYFILSLAFGVLILSLQGTWGREMNGYAFGQRILFGCYALFEYITKTLLPVKLNYLYPYPVPTGGEAHPIVYYAYPLLVFFLFVWIFMQRKNSWLLFGCLFFLIHISMMLHVVQMPRYTIVADRYLYLSLVGGMFVVANVFMGLMGRWEGHGLKRWACVLFLVLYGCYFASYTFNYSKRWKDNDTVKSYLREFLKRQNQREDGEESFEMEP